MKTFTTAIALMAVAASAKTIDYGFGEIEYSGDISDATRTFAQICEENGFDFETHEVTTEDGYILSVWRIPG